MSSEVKGVVYLVYAPESVSWSAGIKVLHKLKLAIRKTGREVVLINHGRSSMIEKLRISRQISSLNRRRSMFKFVAIYPESINGNPLGVKHRIRWILNFPGLLGGPRDFSGDVVWAYSGQLARAIKSSSPQMPDVLFIPALSESEIQSLRPIDAKDLKRSFNLIYAQKYRALGGIPNLELPDVLEITKFEKGSPDRDETLGLVQNAQSLHVFENSTIVTEAQLCGIPVFLHRNQFFDNLLGADELGEEGTSWSLGVIPSPDPELVRERLTHYEMTYPKKLDSLLSNYEDNLRSTEFHSPRIRFNPWISPNLHRIRRLSAIARGMGLKTAIRFISGGIKRQIRHGFRNSDSS